MKKISNTLISLLTVFSVGTSLLTISNYTTNANGRSGMCCKDSGTDSIVYFLFDTEMYGGAGYYLGYCGDSLDVVIPSEVNNSLNSEKYINSSDTRIKSHFDSCKSFAEKTDIRTIRSFYIWQDGIDYSILDYIYSSNNEYYDLEKTAAVKNITISEGIEEIDSKAFSNCTSLESITFPSTINSIANDAFDGTVWLEKQPDGIIYINNIAVTYKGNMPKDTKLEIKAGTKSISAYAFQNAKNLKEVIIPDTVTVIEAGTFFNCSELTEVTIPDSVTEIRGNPFLYCKSDNLVIIANEGTAAEEYAKSIGFTFKSLSDVEENENTETSTEEKSNSDTNNNANVSSVSDDKTSENTNKNNESDSFPVIPIVIGIVIVVAAAVAVVLILKKSKKKEN